MDDALLSYYNRELAYIRKLGAEFAEQHPKIAGRLRLDKEAVEDPHVSRLIESFAFLTARIRHTIDDSFPELTEALMGILYPDFHAPVPSMSIAQYRIIPEVPTPNVIAKGRPMQIRDAVAGSCNYRNCYETDLLPVTLSNIRFASYPVKAPSLPKHMIRNGGNQAVMQVKLSAFETQQFSLDQVKLDHLRFYINAQPQVAFRLYEYILNNATGIAIAQHANDPNAVFLDSKQLQPFGLDDDSALLFDGRTSRAHRLLAEYFAFPEKFLFFTLNGLEDIWSRFDKHFTIFIYFDQSHPELVQGVDDDTLALGCSPLVNLFEAQTEAIWAEEVGIEKRLRVEEGSMLAADIHTVKRVVAHDQGGTKIELYPFYGPRPRDGVNSGVYWHLRRETSQVYKGRASRGTDTYIAFVDENFELTKPGGNWIIYADVICTNRDAPSKLPFGPDQPQVSFMTGGAGLRAKCITPPSATIQPRLDNASRWQLVTQLSLQSFSGPNSLAVLKEALQLYDFQASRESQSVIDGIVAMRCELSTARLVQQGRGAVCQGTHIILEFDEHFYSGSGLYLFSALLSEFFAQFCTINSFTQLTVNVIQRPGRPITWPPRSGSQQLV